MINLYENASLVDYDAMCKIMENIKQYTDFCEVKAHELQVLREVCLQELEQMEYIPMPFVEELREISKQYRMYEREFMIGKSLKNCVFNLMETKEEKIDCFQEAVANTIRRI